MRGTTLQIRSQQHDSTDSMIISVFAVCFKPVLADLLFYSSKTSMCTCTGSNSRFLAEVKNKPQGGKGLFFVTLLGRA